MSENSDNNAIHSQILKSTAIIGGSSGINVVLRIVQAKVVALLVGTEGMGMIGLFNSATGLASTVAGMGLNTSGVRQIADADASGDQARIARTIMALRRATLFFGLLGTLAFFLFRKQISIVTFGDELHADAVGLTALVPLFTVVAASQSALVQGLRRIGDLARIQVFSALFGIGLGIPVLIIWGKLGIAAYLVVIALAGTGVSWWHARKIKVDRSSIRPGEIVVEAKGMLSLGVTFMAAGLTTVATLYIIKIIVTRHFGLPATGLFEASTTLSNVYVGFILSAMAADYFPQLSALSSNDDKSMQLINAQVEVGLLIATPGILAVLAFGPHVLYLLYSSEFMEAFDVLRWQALGTFLRVMSWPFGFLLLARGRRMLFFWSEVAANLCYLGLVVLGVRQWHLAGVGVAFLGMYVFYFLLMAVLARHLIAFRWSSRNLVLAGCLLPTVVASLVASYLLATTMAVLVGNVLLVGVTIVSARRICRIIGLEKLKSCVRSLLVWLHLYRR